MCGKPLAFRHGSFFISSRSGEAQPRRCEKNQNTRSTERHSLSAHQAAKPQTSFTVKLDSNYAQPFRTSGGKAANEFHGQARFQLRPAFPAIKRQSRLVLN
jgi:hypothetical protein